MSGDVRERVRVRLVQTAPLRAEVEHNRAQMARAARSAADEGVDIVIFPELALTGYDLGGRTRELALSLDDGPGLELPEEGPLSIHGLVEAGDDHLVYNTAVAARGSRIMHVHRKVFLPTYGSFDEGRVFAPGRSGVRTFEALPGWRTGLLVCEDLWHPSLAYLLATRGAELLIVISAAIGRGEPSGPDPEHGRFGSAEAWELLARTTALVHGCWLVLVNRAGVEGPLTFAGGSAVAAPDGRIVARATDEGPDVLDVVLEREAVHRARHPYAHLRDEDPHMVARELGRIVEERTGR